MKFIALKTKDGSSKGNITFFCRVLHVSRQGYYQYLVMKDRPWKYQPLADAMKDILTEDICNDTYGRTRMYQALTMKQPKNVDIPSERTVYRVMEEIGISHHPRRKPNGITKADRGIQYTSQLYREAIQKYGIQQSMNSAGGRCHDNARCESMWARMKTELLYDRYDTEKMTTDELKTIIWRYFTSYWNNRRICSTNRGLPPMIKRQQYYVSLKEAA